MPLVYFPSCKFTAKYPQTSQAIQRYLQGKARVAGCCRPGLDELTEGDTAVYICNTCAAFLRESSRAKTVLSLWEVVLGDSDFPFPDHRGRVMTAAGADGRRDPRAAGPPPADGLLRLHLLLSPAAPLRPLRPLAAGGGAASPLCPLPAPGAQGADGGPLPADPHQ